MTLVAHLKNSFSCGQHLRQRSRGRLDHIAHISRWIRTALACCDWPMRLVALISIRKTPAAFGMKGIVHSRNDTFPQVLPKLRLSPILAHPLKEHFSNSVTSIKAMPRTVIPCPCCTGDLTVRLVRKDRTLYPADRPVFLPALPGLNTRAGIVRNTVSWIHPIAMNAHPRL